MNNDKLGYEIYYIDPSAVVLRITIVGNVWQLEIHKYINGTKFLLDRCSINEQNHKNIAELIEMPWEYYEKCLEDEYNPVLLMTNVNHWLRDQGILRLIYSIHIQRDKSGFQINLKEKI